MSERDQIESAREPVNYGAAEPIAAALRRLRWRVRSRLVVERLAAVLAAAILAILLAAALDFIVRLPMAMRLAALALGVLISCGWLVGRLWPLIRFRPGLVELALRVERAPGADKAGLPGRLASALDLAGHPPEWADQSLVSRAVSDAVARFRSFKAAAALRRGSQSQRGMFALCLALIPILVLFWAFPIHARIGTLRVLSPWLAIEWPKVTGVTSATIVSAHPIDAPLTLRAIVHKTNQPVGQTRVEGRWRVKVDGVAGPLTRVLMNPVRKPGEADKTGEVYEAAISRDALALAVGVGGQTRQAVIEYQFSTSDDETPNEAIALVERPQIAEARVFITPPAYAAGAKDSAILSGMFAVQADSTGRATLTPVLAGSRVKLDFRLSKPVPVPGFAPEASMGPAAEPDRDRFISDTFGAAGLPAGATLSLTEIAWKIEFNAADVVTLETRPVDGWGIPAAEAFAIAFAVQPDQPPTVAMTDPPADESVLPTALIPLTGEARDDIALAWAELRFRTLVRPESAGAPPEPKGEPTSTAHVDGVGAGSAKTKMELDLATLSVKPGDEVEIQAAAADAFEGRAPVVSAARKLRIISEAQLTQQVLDDLAALRTAADRLAREQAGLRENTAKAAGADPDPAKVAERRAELEELRARQGAIADRVTPARELLDRAKARIDRNAMTDRSLRDMLDQASQLAEKAAGSAKAAEEDISRAAADPKKPSDENKATLDREQADAADKLAQLADMLSQGQDAFAARRQVEKLLADQKALAQEAAKATQQSAGKKKEQLTAEEKSQLDRLASQQQDLARRAERATEELSQRAEAVKSRDPAQAEAMKKAAEQARKQDVARKMDEASKELRENQGEQAADSQEQAEEALKQVLDQLDKAQQKREEVLERLMADLARSIQALIDAQKAELGALADASKSGSFKGLADGMNRLYGNTIALAGSTAVREAQVVIERLNAASDNQGRAAGLLRTEKIDDAAAEREERSSLTRLEEALAEAKKKQQEAAEKDSNRKRMELAQKYAEVVQKQGKLNDDTKPLAGAELTRRDRATARGLATRQAEVRGEVDKLREELTAGGQADLFDYAHRRFDGLAQRAEKPMEAGDVPAGVARDQAEAYRILKSVAGALMASAKQGQDPFRKPGQGNEQNGGQNQPGGDQNQQQNSMIPPIAQIMLLRTMQQEAAERTRALGEAGVKADTEELASVAELQRDLAEIGKKVVEAMNQKNPLGKGDKKDNEGGRR